MEEARRSFVPAAGHDWLLPLYDPLVALLGGNAARRALVEQAGLRPGHRVLDVGCGTGSLIVLIKGTYAGAEVVGLDPDQKALALARRKVERAGLAVHLDQGFSDRLPYEDGRFDRVFSTFMLHHLQEDEKEKTLREARRVLAPGGSLHLLDFAPGQHDSGFLARLLHTPDELRENSSPHILAWMEKAGFADPREVEERRMLFGRIAYYRATAPAA